MKKKFRMIYLAFFVVLVLVLVLMALAGKAGAWTVTGAYSEGLTPVSEDGKWGYANASGGLAIPLRFDEAGAFSLGTALVKETGKYGLIRQDGLWLLDPVYDTLIDLGYGVYLGNGSALLSAVPFPGADGKDTHVLYEGVTVTKSGSSVTQIQYSVPGSAEPTVIAPDGLPALLKARDVPGSDFPLSPARKAAFTDVGGKDWFGVWVGLAYNTGLMEGPGDGKFNPYKSLTVAEALKLAAVLDSGGSFQLKAVAGKPWYAGALDYCLKNGIITDTTFAAGRYETPITRAELALVFAATAPMRNATDLNAPARVQTSIPDVAKADYAASAIYTLYAKGIVSGSDKQLTFRPDAVITRSEVAAIVARMARPEQRILLWSSGAAASAA